MQNNRVPYELKDWMIDNDLWELTDAVEWAYNTPATGPLGDNGRIYIRPFWNSNGSWIWAEVINNNVIECGSWLNKKTFNSLRLHYERSPHMWSKVYRSPIVALVDYLIAYEPEDN
jgi:hypothetical protein